MDEEWREYFLIWAQTREFKETLKKTEKMIEEVKERYSKIGILYSGGKDSTVGVHIALQHIPDVHVFHYYYTYNIPPHIEREILSNLKKLGVKNIHVAVEKVPLPDDRGFFAEVRKFIKTNKIECVLSCLRAEESGRRKVLTAQQEELFGAKNAHVLAHWTWRDVWAYIVSRNLPHMNIYNKYAGLLGWDKARFAPLFSPDLEHIGAQNIDGILMWEYKNLANRKTKKQRREKSRT